MQTASFLVGSASIVQRSGSKQVKATLDEILKSCSDCERDLSLNATTFAALMVLRKHAVDSYYQVIMRKYNGVETLELAAKTFAANPEIAALCLEILENLQSTDNCNHNKKQMLPSSPPKHQLPLVNSLVLRSVHGMMVKFPSSSSPRTVTSVRIHSKMPEGKVAAPDLTKSVSQQLIR
jgi:hypothetical protein